jgi:hypothetical protein
MRIALIFDTHGNLAALEAVVAPLRQRGVDDVVCFGDNFRALAPPADCAVPDGHWLGDLGRQP